MLNDVEQVRSTYFPLRVIGKLGQGSFGEVCLVEAKDNNRYALKKERRMFTPEEQEQRKSRIVPQLYDEMRIYKSKLFNVPSVPRAFCYWKTDEFRILMLEAMGQNLENPVIKMQLRNDVLLFVATRLVQGLAFIHRAGVIHRDVKPENIVIGQHDDVDRIGPQTNFKFIDFGLSKCFREQDGRHIPWVTGKHMTGTARFASINTHQGNQQSRRDDLESLGYCFVYMQLQKLPWMGRGGDEKLIAAIKMKTDIPTLCKDCPVQIQEYMQYVRCLQFDQDPDYELLVQILRPRQQQTAAAF